jgi:hypothetical protein
MQDEAWSRGVTLAWIAQRPATNSDSTIHASPRRGTSKMSKRDDYQTKMEEQLALWAARLEALTTKVDAKVKVELHKQVEEWKAAGTVATAKLAELRATAGDKWDVIKVEMDKVWHAIAAALEHGEASRRDSEDSARAAASATTAPMPAQPGPGAAPDAAAPVDQPITG